MRQTSIDELVRGRGETTPAAMRRRPHRGALHLQAAPGVHASTPSRAAHLPPSEHITIEDQATQVFTDKHAVNLVPLSSLTEQEFQNCKEIGSAVLNSEVA